MKLLLKCPICKTRRTSSSRCWKCKKHVPDSAITCGTGTKRKAYAPRVQDVARSENQEAKEDEAAKRLPVQTKLEERPCRRCGRLVLVQQITEEERRKLRTLPVAVECEKPCEMRVMA